MINLTIDPDLKTRESVMAAAGRVQLAVATPGGTRYVKIEAKRRNPVEAVKRYTAVPLDEATHVFVSEKGYGTTSLGTYYPPKAPGQPARFFENDRVAIDPAHVQALTWAVDHINGDPVPADVEIVAESQCGLCGRKLEDPESVRRGIGPECAQKPTGTKILHASVFAAQEQLPPVQERRVHAAPAQDAAPDPVSADDNNADRALVETGVDVRSMTAHQMAVLTAAVAEENAIRAARDRAAAHGGATVSDVVRIQRIRDALGEARA